MPEALSSLRLPAWLKPDDLRYLLLENVPDCLRMTRAGRFLPSSPRLMTWGTVEWMVLNSAGFPCPPGPKAGVHCRIS